MVLRRFTSRLIVGVPRCSGGNCSQIVHDVSAAHPMGAQLTLSTSSHKQIYPPLPDFNRASEPPGTHQPRHGGRFVRCDQSLPVGERSVWPPMGRRRAGLGHRLDERELRFVDAHAEAGPIVRPHLAVPALEELGQESVPLLLTQAVAVGVAKTKTSLRTRGAQRSLRRTPRIRFIN